MRTRSLRTVPLVLIVSLVFSAAACDDDDDDGTGPSSDPLTQADVAGDYEATTFTTTTDGAVTDQLEAGAVLSIGLAVDGTTTGLLFVPGAAEDGSDFEADLTGTWTFDEASRQIMFDQTADTFVRDMTFVAQRAAGSVRLAARRSFGPTTFDVVLER